MPRLFLLLLNAVAFGFLLYGIVSVYQLEPPGVRKLLKLTAGIVLLLLPVAMLSGFIRPTPVYLLVYPFGIAAFVFLARLRD